MESKITINKNKILTIGELKEKDIDKITINKIGDIDSYEIIENENDNFHFNKNNIICDEFIEIE